MDVLFDAVCVDDVSCVSHCLAKCPSLCNARSGHGASPLHVCASRGAMGCASALLTAGACVNAVDRESGWTPLHCAIYRRDIGMVALLLSSGATLTEPADRSGSSPMDLLTTMRAKPRRAERVRAQAGDVYRQLLVFGRNDGQLGLLDSSDAVWRPKVRNAHTTGGNIALV